MRTALVIILLLAILAGAVFVDYQMGISWRRRYACMGLADDGPRYLLYPFSWRRSHGLGVLQ